MTATVEILEKLERKMTLTLPVQSIEQEVGNRLKKLARTVKMDGFRPGKVPMSVVAQRYGYSVHYEVMNDKVGEAFSQAANEANLRVAGQPRISEKENSPEGAMAFDAVFEVYPDVQLGDLSQCEVEKVSAEVSDAAIDKTIDILRKQRRTFSQRPADAIAQESDRATVDFEGKIDGEAFPGGKAEGFQFLIGDGQMLKEFEEAVRGMKIGESKTFPIDFPADYQDADVAGKQADFMVTVKKIEAAHLPAVDDALALSLGIAEATVEGLRADIRKNLEREVKFRTLSRNKNAAMDAILSSTALEIPNASVQSELNRMVDRARAEMKRRGMKNTENLPVPEDLFRPQAEKRVRLGLIVAELVRSEALQAKPEQIKMHIEELAASYERPLDVVRWYLGDSQRLAEVEAVVLENNVADFVMVNAKVTEKMISFDELMAQN